MENKTTPKIKKFQFFSLLVLNDTAIYLRNRPIEFDVGIVNLHPSNGTQLVVYTNENFYDSHGCAPPNKLSKNTIRRDGHCLHSEYKIQGLKSGRDPFLRKLLFIYNLPEKIYRN